MVIIRKPPKNAVDKVDRFIGDAAVKNVTAPIVAKPIESKPNDRNETKKLKYPVEKATADETLTEEIVHHRLHTDKFRRETFKVHKDLVKAIKKTASNGSKGEKTRIINLALKKFFEAEENRK
jgi:hypothetical protein